jgi:hypothetical protein
MLSDSITYRALELVHNNPKMEILEAVKQAITEENNMLSELVENKTDRSKNLREEMCKTVYTSIHLKELFK